MPTIHKWDGYRAFFYSNEGNEPPHVHVVKAEHEAKFWLSPLVLAVNTGFPNRELTTISEELISQEESLLKEWDDYFGNRNRRS
ncbi:MAG: DUF4160 domain-containing protein [Pseudorhodoplanes sp.]|uniref:DUF4160 domain-containing protein n=1 Tax=Pseudorhodoplanes sp. TaxID=1934341 RepID=UPI003D1188D4